jgi:LEM-3-like GIY-YIG domain
MPHSRYRFYVYLLLDPAGQPFYIGKGSGGRILDHEREARSGHDCPKCDAIRAIWSAGGQIVKTIVFETDDEQEALVREAELIEQYGLTTLTNKVAGGRGTRGYRFNADQLAQRSYRRRTYRLHPNFREMLIRAGYTLCSFCAEYDLSLAVIRAALHRAKHKGGLRRTTAWKIARAYAKLTAQSEEAAYQAIIIDPHSSPLDSDENR